MLTRCQPNRLLRDSQTKYVVLNTPRRERLASNPVPSPPNAEKTKATPRYVVYLQSIKTRNQVPSFIIVAQGIGSSRKS